MRVVAFAHQSMRLGQHATAMRHAVMASVADSARRLLQGAACDEEEMLKRVKRHESVRLVLAVASARAKWKPPAE